MCQNMLTQISILATELRLQPQGVNGINSRFQEIRTSRESSAVLAQIFSHYQDSLSQKIIQFEVGQLDSLSSKMINLIMML